MNTRRVVLMLFVAAAVVTSTGCGSDRVSPLAVQREHEGLIGRYVGGTQHFGQPRRAEEGTWGTDYRGLDLLGWIELRWSHDESRRQDGIGNY